MQVGQIAIYRGQNGNEGSLTDACSSGDYKIVLLAFLNQFGAGRTPGLNFAGHCGDWNPCTKLQPEIKYRQSIDVKVFLSFGGAIGDYSLASDEDAKEVAKYLYNSFLSCQSGPLGAIELDGIDLDFESGSRNHYDDLARELDSLRRENNYFYLFAAPECPIPDYYLDAAIRTGLFDCVCQVQFYNNPPCQYASGNPSLLLSSWNTWASLLFPNNSLFLGLPAHSTAAYSGGYIPPGNLINEILPMVKETANYGGVMLWSRYHNNLSSPTYSEQIKDYVVKLAAAAYDLFGSVSAVFFPLWQPYLHRCFR